MVYQLRRWLPERQVVLVVDRTYTTLEFLHACQTLAHPVAVITRLRLALYTPKPSEKKGQLGRKRKKGVRLPTPQVFIDHPHTRWQSVTVR